MRADIIANGPAFVLLTGDFTQDDSYLRVSDSPGGEVDDWIVYGQWAGQPQAILHGEPAPGQGGSGSDWPPFMAFDVEYVAAAGLHFTNDRTSADNIIARGAANCQLLNCRFRGRGLKLGDSLGGGSDSWIVNPDIDDIGDILDNTGDGIFAINGSNRNRIISPIIRKCGHAAMTIGGVSDGTEADCEDNVVTNYDIRNVWAGGIILNGKSLRTVLEPGIVGDSASSGLGDPGTKDGIVISGRNNVIKCPTIFNCKTEGLKFEASVWAGFNGQCNGNRVYHPTIFGCGGAPIIMVCRNGLDAAVDLINNEIDNAVGWDNHRNGANAAGRFDNGNYQMIFIDLFNAGAVWAANNLGGNKFRNNGLARTTAADNWAVIVRSVANGDNLYYTKAQFEAAFLNCSGNIDAQDPEFVDEDGEDFQLGAGSYARDTGRRLTGVPWLDNNPDRGAIEEGSAPDFSSTPIRSTFDVADETPLSDGGRFAGPVSSSGTIGSGQMRVTGNLALAAQAGNCHSYDDTPLPANQKVFVTVHTKPANTKFLGLWTRVANPNTASMSGYFALLVTLPDAADLWRVYRVEDNVEAQLTGDAFAELETGSRWGLKSVGDTISLWMEVAGVWCRVGTWVDPDPLLNAGFIGLGASDQVSRANDFGGGPLEAESGLLFPPAALGIGIGLGL